MRRTLLFAAVAVLLSATASAQCGIEYGDLVINEFMARNIVHADQDGEFDDWVEIHNTTDEDVNMQGYFLSDNHGNRTRFTFPDTVLESGGYMVIWCDGQIEQEGLHTEYGINGTIGERIILVDPDTVVIDHHDFGPVDNIQSFSRYPNGHGPFRFALPTPGAPNNETDYQGLVINEFLALNTSSGTDEFGNHFDWIEMYNNRDIPLNLGGYILSDESNDPTNKYAFPEPTIVASGGYVMVYADGTQILSDFHANFGLNADVGEYLHLYNKDTVTLDFIKFGPQLEDISVGRFENGLGPFSCLEPTMEASNSISNVSVPELVKNDEILFSVYPVPATDFINIQLTDTGQGVISIFSAYGTHVANYAYTGDGPHYIDLSDFAKGVYLVRIGNNTRRIVVR